MQGMEGEGQGVRFHGREVAMPEVLVQAHTRKELFNLGLVDAADPEIGGQLVVCTKPREVLLNFHTLVEEHQ